MASIIRYFLKTSYGLLIFSLGITLGGIPHSYAVAAPDQLKAAYLYNFAKLTYWPETANPDDPLVICTAAAESFTRELIEVSSKPVAGRNVQVVALGLKSAPDFCNMVFVDKQHSRSWFKYHHDQQKGQLLVGENPGFIAKGGVINFFLDGDKLRFEVSIHNAQQRGVQISSRLLRLARIVEDTNE